LLDSLLQEKNVSMNYPSMQLRENDRNLEAYEQALTSWTDDVPTCRESGVGSAINELYRRDGSRIQIHSFQDRSFRFRVDEYELCVYGILDGFGGPEVADFVTKRIPAELLWGQLNPEKSDEAVKDTLRQAFISADKEYFESIGDKLAARMVMRSDPQYSSSSQLRELDDRVRSGASAVLAAVLKDRLFVASVGDCRALLYRNGEILPLSIDHTTENEDEVLRLAHLGVDLLPGNHIGELGEHQYTRCFGNYPVKGGYKENPLLGSARDEPVIPEPEVHGGIPVQDSSFLLLYTHSLWHAVAEATGAQDPDAEIAELCKHYFKAEPSLSGVAQAVVDQIVRLHHERLEVSGGRSDTREDITLLIREFGSCLKKEEKTLTRNSARTSRPTRSSTTTESSSVYTAGKELPVDEDGRIQPYVDFAPFYQLWNSRSPAKKGSESPEKLNNSFGANKDLQSPEK